MRLAALSSFLTALLLAPQGANPPPANADRAAWQVVDLATMKVVESQHPDRLAAPAPPGSFMKLPTLVAALASHTISRTSRVVCRGEADVAGHVIRCSHPRVRHALRPDEALALSCNVYFATIAERLPRTRLNGVLTALGLPPVPASAPMPLAATGLQGTAVPPEALLRALARLVMDPATVPLGDEDRRVVLDGLRGSALYGTSSAFAMHGVEALAKTGTADAPGGGVQGLVVALWPAAAPVRGIVLVAPGVSGMDAADLAARIAAGRGDAPTSEQPGTGAAAGAPETPVDVTPAGPVLRIGTPRPGGGYDVRTLPLEDYVARVLAGEAAPHSPPAALEALAIAARTFALANRGRHRRDGFDLCTLTHCQVLRDPDAPARAAVQTTAGRVLTWHGALAQVFYTASCGGVSEVPSAVWPGADDPPYLRVRRDRACRGEPHWSSEIPAPDLDRVLHGAGFTGGRLRDLRRDGRTRSGRVARLRLVGLAPPVISAQDFRTLVGRQLGWQLLKSTDFTVRRTGGGFRFEGHGFGHGVGLCVLGSVARAADGDGAAAILRAYFPGLDVTPLAKVEPGMAPVPAPAAPPAPTARPTTTPGPAPAADPPVGQPSFTLVLPPSAEHDRGVLADLVSRSLAAIVRATGRSAPSDLRVVFHPSAASFQRETGASWWSSARTRGARIDLVPPDMLRARGTLDLTVRHELAHVVTAPLLADRPEWVREGAAMHFAGEPPPQSMVGKYGEIRRVRCPSDLDLRRPASAAQARQAYGLAAACFERALAAARGDWTEVR